MKLIYLPGTGSLTYNCWINEPIWGEKGSYLDYRHFLLNYFYIRDYANDLKKRINVIPGIHFTDSGGYQQFSQGVNLNPKDVILEQQKVGQYGIILDCPPYNFKSTFQAEFDDRHFDNYLDKTKRNVDIAINNLHRKDFRLYGVIHGILPKYQIKWYQKLKEMYDFYGWCISIKPPPDVYGITRLVLFANYLGIRNLHIFGIGGYTKIQLLYYLKDMFDDEFDMITYDSTSAYMQAKNKIFSYFGNDNTKIKTAYIGSKSAVRTTTSIPHCDCAVCSNIDRSVFLDSSADGTECLNKHNLNLMIRFIGRLEQSDNTNYSNFKINKLVYDYKKDKRIILKYSKFKLVKDF